MTSATAMPTPTTTAAAMLFAAGMPEPNDQNSWQKRAWKQVLARDRAADGSFVYAVRSTGIFCRPSCPSRRPEPARVEFFSTVQQARTAGYRACLRCRPEQASAAESARDRSVIAAVLQTVDGREGERCNLAALSAATGLAGSAIRRAFARSLGTTPTRFLRERRLRSFREALAPSAGVEANPVRITDAVYDAGFGSSSRLYEGSDASLGMTPSAMRAGAPGERITYLTAGSPLGRVLVAATERGVCAIHFADTDEALRRELRQRFPKAVLVAWTGQASEGGVNPDGGQGTVANRGEDKNREARAGEGHWLLEAVQFVLSQLTESPEAAHFPLDVRATAFQQRVWQALREIPRGTRISYAALARQLGQPTAARAVAGACSRNPVALAIPCHRVVGETGALAGYRWGLERKRALLEAEQPRP